ncbi:MAG: RNA polymerase sigma factor [Actinobacteria bacterium]|nr:RNA polymerase sigma factor [Actinomycetota bacterium]
MAIRVPLEAHDSDDDADGHGISANVAFSELWQHRAALRDICQRIVGDAATADDVVQETYLRALRNLDRLERRPTLMPWLATVARRRSIDELRRRQYQRPVDAMPDESTRPEFDPGEAAGVSETVSRVREALTALTDRERELLTRQVNQGLSLSELAALDNSSVASVRSVLSRARTKLRDALTDAGARIAIPLAGFGGRFRDRIRARVGDKVGAMAARAERVVVLPGGVAQVAETATAALTAAVIAIGGLGPATAAAASGGTSTDQVAVSGLAASAGSAAGDSDASPTPSLGGGSGHRVAAVDTPAGLELSAASEGSKDSNHSETPGGGNPQSGGDEGGLPNPTGGPIHTPQLPPDPEPEPEQPEGSDVGYVGGSKDSGGDGADPEGGAGSEDGATFALGTYRGNCIDGCAVLFRSTDGGANWEKRDATGLDDSATTLIIVDDQFLFAHGPDGLQRSSNGGASFESIGEAEFGDPATRVPDFDADPRIFFGGITPMAYDARTGMSTPLTLTGLGTDTKRFAFDPAFGTTKRLFAATVAVTPDGLVPAVHTCINGDCTQSVPLSFISGVPTGIHVSSSFGAPLGGELDQNVFAWGNGAFYRSGDGGESFVYVDDDDLDARIANISDDGAGTYYAAATGSGATGVLRSTDAGRSWIKLGAGTSLADGAAWVTALGDGRVIAAPIGGPEGHGGILCSSDRGGSWSPRCGD